MESLKGICRVIYEIFQSQVDNLLIFDVKYVVFITRSKSKMRILSRLFLQIVWIEIENLTK